MTRERARDDVLGRLREAILSGRIRPGERLPGERQLCERLGVGRPTLREALRSLEATGLIVVRPGKGGGSYPATPSEAIVGDAVAALVSLPGGSPAPTCAGTRRSRARPGTGCAPADAGPRRGVEPAHRGRSRGRVSVRGADVTRDAARAPVRRPAERPANPGFFLRNALPVLRSRE